MARFRLPFRIPFFRIFYSTTYTSLFVLVLVVLAITPASLIYSAIKASAWQYPFMIGGTYFLTALLAIFIYTSRLYTNRTVLAAVGKSYIPVEEGEVGRNVRRMVAKCLQRSALIAWEARPRDLAAEDREVSGHEHRKSRRNHHRRGPGDDSHLLGTIIKVDPQSPPWGHVQHPGWSSPSRFETTLTPHVHFGTVFQELPHLIEAQAVSFAPPDPDYIPSDPTDLPLADPRIVEVLQRPPTTGLREYLNRLVNLGVFSDPTAVDKFLAQYEYARFNPVPLLEPQFSTLMAAFADLLTCMTAPPPHLLEATAKFSSSNTSQALNDTSSLAASTHSIATSISSNTSAIHHRSASPALPSVYATIANDGFLTVPGSPQAMLTPQSRTRTPSYLHPLSGNSRESVSSVIRSRSRSGRPSVDSTQSGSTIGSVIRRPTPSPGASSNEWFEAG